MQTTILLASVLKPVTDVRLYAKLALALAAAPHNTQLHIIGAKPSTFPIPKPHNIYFYPLAVFPRISWARLAYQIVFLRTLLQLRPSIVIANTVELLPMMVVYKYFFAHKKTTLVYDIMENYYQNITYQQTYPSYLRKVLAVVVACIERFFSMYIDKFILAEKCFINELQKVWRKPQAYILAENKFQPPITDSFIPKLPPIQLKLTQSLHFVYTGTVSQAYGLLEAIDLLKKVAAQNPTVRCTIIGFCSDEAYYQKILMALQQTHFITNHIRTDQPVAHHEIMKVLQQADVALLPYLPNISTANRLPTKFYEYMYYRVPMVIPENQSWKDFCAPYRSAMAINFQQITANDFLAQLSNTIFYNTSLPVSTLCWGTADQHLLQQFILEEPNLPKS